jgi:nicotinate-nucleotide pyrophosphorylase (carboxylating)
VVRQALLEDLGDGDITTEAIVTSGRPARGVLLAKSACVVAGLDIVTETFRQVDASVSASFEQTDGEYCAVGAQVAAFVGPASALLAGERTALNFLQRLSGIATLTRRFVEAAGGRLVVLDTRKTTPNLRTLEKYAVALGGAMNHRAGLFDAILIKDNHIRLAGSVGEAVARVRARRPGMQVEVEAQSLVEVDQALDAGADVVLADNLTLDEIRETVRRASGRAKVEVSGGVTLDRMADVAATGADFVSVGALTHSAPAADLSLEIEAL